MNKESYFKSSITMAAGGYNMGCAVKDETLLAFGKEHWEQTQIDLLKQEYHFVYSTGSKVRSLQRSFLEIGDGLTTSHKTTVWLTSVVPDAMVWLGVDDNSYETKVALLFKDPDVGVEFQLRYL